MSNLHPLYAPAPAGIASRGRALVQPDDEDELQLSPDLGDAPTPSTPQVASGPGSSAAFANQRRSLAAASPNDDAEGDFDADALGARPVELAARPFAVSKSPRRASQPRVSAPTSTAPRRYNYTAFADNPVTAAAFAPEIAAERDAQAQDAWNEQSAAREQQEAERAAARQQRQEEAAAAQQARRAHNAEMAAASQTTGVRTIRDEDGYLQPLADPDTGKPLYRPKQGQVQYDPHTGKPFQVNRDTTGATAQVDPDADAPVGPNKDDPSDPQLYRQTKFQPWQPVGHVDELADDGKQPGEIRAAAQDWQQKRGAAIFRKALGTAEGRAAHAQATHVGAQNRLAELNKQIGELTPQYDTAASGEASNDAARDADLARKTHSTGWFSSGPTDEAVAAAARNAERAKKIEPLQEEQKQLAAQIGEDKAPGPLALAVAASKADAQIMRHAFAARNWTNVADQRRKILAEEGKPEEGDEILATAIRNEQAFNVKKSDAEQQLGAMHQQAAEAGHDLSSWHSPSQAPDATATLPGATKVTVQALTPAAPNNPAEVQPFAPTDKPFRADAEGNLTFDPSRMVKGILAARDAGLITPDKAKQMYPQAAKAQVAAREQKAILDEMKAKEKSAGRYSEGKAVVAGASKAAGFMAAAPAGAAIGAEAGGLTGPFAPILSPLGGIVGGLVTGTLGSMAVDHATKELARHSETIKSFTDSSEIHSQYDAAGNLVAFAGGIPKALTSAATKGLGAAGAPTIAKAYQAGTGSLIDTVGKFSSQAAVHAADGASAAQIATKIAGQVAKPAAAMVGIDTALKEGGRMLGLSDDHQTWGGVAQAAAVGAFLSGHGIKIENYKPEQVGDILLRGKAAEGAGQKLTDALSPVEAEIYQRADRLLAKNPGAKAGAARQATEHGRPNGVAAVSLEPAEGHSSDVPPGPSNPSSPSEVSAAPPPARPAGQAPADLAARPPEQVAADFAARNPGAPVIAPAVIAKSHEYVPPGQENVPEPVERADARIAATQQIAALPDVGGSVHPETGELTPSPDPAGDRDTAGALLKLASGFPVEHLTIAEQERLKPKGSPALVRKAPNGATILTDAGRERLKSAAPAAATFIRGTEAQDIRQIIQPSRPGPEPTPASPDAPQPHYTPGDTPQQRADGFLDGHGTAARFEPHEDVPSDLADSPQVRLADGSTVTYDPEHHGPEDFGALARQPPNRSRPAAVQGNTVELDREQPTSKRGLEMQKAEAKLEQLQRDLRSQGRDLNPGQQRTLAQVRANLEEELARQRPAPSEPPLSVGDTIQVAKRSFTLTGAGDEHHVEVTSPNGQKLKMPREAALRQRTAVATEEDLAAHQDQALREHYDELAKEARADLDRSGGVELLDAVRAAGGLPVDDPVFRGELNAIRESSAPVNQAGRSGTFNLFRRSAPSLDTLTTELRGQGFDLETPGDLLTMLHERVSTKHPQYGFAARADANSGMDTASARYRRGSQTPTTPEELKPVQERYRAMLDRLSPNTSLRIEAIKKGQLNALWRGHGEPPPDIQAAFLDNTIYLVGEALQSNPERTNVANLLHEAAHSYERTLPPIRRKELELQWHSEVKNGKGPLHGADGKLLPEVDQRAATDFSEWLAESLGWANAEWAQGRATANSPIGRLAQNLRDLLQKLYSAFRPGAPLEKLSDEFRGWLARGARTARGEETHTFDAQAARRRSRDEETEDLFGREQDPSTAVTPTTSIEAPPRLRSGEKGTGDLFQGEDQPFNLVGENGIDHAARQQEQEQAARGSAEAKAAQEREQQRLFSQEPAAAAADRTPDPSRRASVQDLVTEALTPGTGERKSYAMLGTIGPEQAAKLKAGTGLDLEGYRHNIDTSAVRHVWREHGDAQAEIARGNAPLSEEDFARLPGILANPDASILAGKNDRGLDVILHAKRVNGHFVIAEEVRSRRGILSLTTFYKKSAPPLASGAGGEPTSSLLQGNAQDILRQIASQSNFLRGDSGGETRFARRPTLSQTLQAVGNEFNSREAKDRIPAWYDAADTSASMIGHQARNTIKLDLPAAIDREAMPFVVEAGGDVHALQDMLAKVRNSSTPELARKFEPLVQHAISEFNRLDAAKGNYQAIAAKQLAIERRHGIGTRQVQDYVTRRLELPENLRALEPVLLGGSSGGAGASRYFAKGRDFATLADAIEAGYEPRSTDLGDLLAHRVSAGQRLVRSRRMYGALKSIPVPGDAAGRMIITDPEPHHLPNGKVEMRPPQGYATVDAAGTPLLVHKQFAGLFSALYGESSVRSNVAGRLLLKAAAGAKNGTLVFDTFHAGRLMFKQLTAGGGIGYNKGLSLLEYNDRDLANAVAAKHISQEHADWALANRPAANELIKAGLNVGRVADNLMGEIHNFVEKIPGFGKIVSGTNAWIFGKLSRGGMLQTALVTYERNLARYPELGREGAARRTAREMNALFGSLGNQGVFKSKTFQDIARITLLAPQWVESQLRSEVSSYGQLAKVIPDALRGRLRVGALGQTMATGVVGMFAANQVLNLITRGKPTWENEEGHTLDAWIPGGAKGRGFWLNPFEIAGEYTHAAEKYLAMGENPVDVAMHIGSNKLSPIARGAVEAATGRDYAGRHFLNDTDRFRSAMVDATPFPMFGGMLMEKDPRQPLGYRWNRQPGSVQRQILQMLGVKTSAAQSPRARMFALAAKYRPDREGGERVGEYQELRRALENGDDGGVRQETRWLTSSQGKSLDDIRHALGIKKDGTTDIVRFTGSAEGDKLMLQGLTPEERKLYVQAQAEHHSDARRFLQLASEMQHDLRPTPTSPTSPKGLAVVALRNGNLGLVNTLLEQGKIAPDDLPALRRQAKQMKAKPRPAASLPTMGRPSASAAPAGEIPRGYQFKPRSIEDMWTRPQQAA